eukprot:2100666-Amphidinium_carterae.1
MSTWEAHISDSLTVFAGPASFGAGSRSGSAREEPMDRSVVTTTLSMLTNGGSSFRGSGKPLPAVDPSTSKCFGSMSLSTWHQHVVGKVDIPLV